MSGLPLGRYFKIVAPRWLSKKLTSVVIIISAERYAVFAKSRFLPPRIAEYANAQTKLAARQKGSVRNTENPMTAAKYAKFTNG